METSEGEEDNLFFVIGCQLMILYLWNLMGVNAIHRGRGMLSDSYTMLVWTTPTATPTRRTTLRKRRMNQKRKKRRRRRPNHLPGNSNRSSHLFSHLKFVLMA